MKKEITIDGVKYTSNEDSKNNPIKIVVFDRGWIAVGNYSVDEKYVYLTNASVIRTWGTENGLGELAEKGPKNTPLDCILDKCPDIKALEQCTVMTMDCNNENWN